MFPSLCPVVYPPVQDYLTALTSDPFSHYRYIHIHVTSNVAVVIVSIGPYFWGYILYLVRQQRDRNRDSGMMKEGQGQRDKDRETGTGGQMFVLFFYAKIFSLPVGFYEKLSCYPNILRFMVLLHW